MSAEARKNCRTQGRYSDNFEDRKPRKSQEKRLKESPSEKETQEKKFLKRKSDGTKEDTSYSSENNESVLEYQENSDYSFEQLQEKRKPIEIKEPGKFILSKTENGESSVLFEPNFYTEDEAWELFEYIGDSTDWLDKNIVIHGVEYPQPRLVAWYGPLPYSYSGTTLEPAKMPDCVLAIKRRVEDYLKGNNIDVELNSVLLNLYRHNKDSVSWHSDDELTMGVCPTIASISLGETRKFEMRPKLNRYLEDDHKKIEDEYFVQLNNGSLIIMDGCMQEDWQHRVPKEYHDRNARINLTFRTVYKFENGSPYSDSRVNNYKPVDKNNPKNPTKIKVNLDEENFPPLGYVSNNVNSKSAHKPYEKDESSQDKIGIKTNKINDSEEQWIVVTPPSNKTMSRINDKINDSEEQWTVETPPAHKIISRINDPDMNDMRNASQEEWVVKTPISTSRIYDRIDDLEEQWTVETPSANKIISRINDLDMNDMSNASQEEWVVETPICTSRVNNRIDDLEEQWTVETPAANKIISGINDPGMKDMSNVSEQEWTVTSAVKNDSYSEFSKDNKSHYNNYKESANKSQLTHPKSDNKSHRDWYAESCNSQILSESKEISKLHEEKYKKSFDYQQQTSLVSDKVYRSDENHFEESYCRRTPLDSNKINKSHENRNAKSSYTRSNRFQSDKTNKYEEKAAKPFNRRNAQLETNRYQRYNERGARESFYDRNISRQNKNFKASEVKRPEYHDIERNTVSNNFNNEKKYEKLEISNENREDYEEKPGKNQNSNFRERRNESSTFAVRSMRRHFSNIRNDPESNRSHEWTPNVKAEEFIPGKMKKPPSKMHTFSPCVDSSTFGHFSLENLLNYDVDRMPSDELKNYANALKLRVSDRIFEFEPSQKEELEVLCEITDGNQTDRNQKIICSRICALVNRTIPNKEWNKINPSSTIPRYLQQANYVNENHYSDRRYRDSS